MNLLKSNSVSLVIPAYNEESRIKKILQDAGSYLSGRYGEFEIIVVDDGSFDKTGDIVTGFMKTSERIKLLKNGKNYGKGYSVKKGVLASSGEIIAFSDADESVPIAELSKFINLIEKGADIVIASRAIEGASILKKQALWRRTMGRIFNIFVKRAALRGIKDTQCGFKCFKREVARDLFARQKINRFAFDVEILYLAHLKGYSIKQVPAVWANSPESKVNPVFDSITMLKDLFIIKSLHRNIKR